VEDRTFCLFTVDEFDPTILGAVVFGVVGSHRSSGPVARGGEARRGYLN
jgi:hypothetical protein